MTMTSSLYEARATYLTTCGQGPRSLLASWVRKSTPHKFLRAQRWRAELNGMTDVELKDIGLSRCQIGAVVNGTFSR